MSYAEGVLEAVRRRAAGRRVSRVGVRIGAVHRVEAEAFEQSFQLAAAGGPAEGAGTVVVVVPVHAHCMHCRADFAATDHAPACPGCGSLHVAVEGGDDVVLEWLQYVDDTAAEHPTEPVPPHTHVGQE
jgi:hydrogenase nickel incorporation protein HypA/HybF